MRFADLMTCKRRRDAESETALREQAGRSARYTRRLERLYLQRQSLSFDMRLIALSFAVSLVGKRLVRRWMRHAAGKLPHEGEVTGNAPPFAAFQR